MAKGEPASLAMLWQDADYEKTFSFSSAEQPGSALDLDLQCDDAYVVRQVVVEPFGLRAHGRPLLDTVVSSDRRALREAVEVTMQEGGITRLRVRLNMGDSPHVLLGVAKVEGANTIGVSGLMLVENDKSMYGPRVDELSLYRDLFERLPVSIFFKDRNATFVGANPRLARTLGQRLVTDVIGQTDKALHHPDEAELLHRSDTQIIETGAPIIGMTESQTRPDGSVEVMHTSKFPIRDRGGEIVGLMGFSHDVTEPTALVEALAQSEQRYALAARATRDGIWDYDLENDEAIFSPRCCQLLDIPITTEAVPWAQIAERLRHDHVAPLMNAVQGLREDAKGVFTQTVAVSMRDGSERWVEMVGTSLAVNGEVVRVIGSATDITDERNNTARLEYLATHDPLTGLGNRRAIMEKIEAALKDGEDAGLLMLDLDYFKVINDSLGHQAGDEVLSEISSRLQELLDPDHVIVRLGGDEFAVFVTNRTRAQILRSATAIAQVIRERMTVSGLDLYMTASIGVVYVDETHDEADQLLRDADIALYEAKGDGKSRVKVFETSMRDAADDALDRQMSIRKAVNNNDFLLRYQPIIDARTSKIRGVEALLRLSPEDGPIKTPNEFLPYLEQTDLIVEVGEWVIESALAALSSWKEQNLVDDDFTVAINASRKQFQTDRLGDYVLEALERYGLQGRNVIIEITETAVLHTDTSIVQILDSLREHGVRIAIDDFGTGQSSLAVLYDLPVDILKIDKSFTDRILADGGDEPVISAAFHVARSMGLVTVAEGVEVEHQAEWLKSQSCDLLQGYLFSQPISPEELLADLQWSRLNDGEARKNHRPVFVEDLFVDLQWRRLNKPEDPNTPEADAV